MVLTKWTAGKNIWADKTLQASAFADDQNPHVHPVTADLDINTIIDGIQSPTVGHIHDGAFGQKIPFSSTVNNAAVTNGPPQTFKPTSASAVPGVILGAENLANMQIGQIGANVPLAVRGISADDTGGTIYFIPQAPGIVIAETSSQYGSSFFPVFLFSHWTTDLNLQRMLITFDPSNIQGFGASALLIGDNAVNVGGNAASGNVKFFGSSGSTFDISLLTGGQILPVKNFNEAAPGGALTTKAITFASTIGTTSYGVNVTPQANAVIWVTNKLATGFTLNYSVAGGVACDWQVFR